MYDFVYTSYPSKVVFATGSLDCVSDEVRALDAKKAIVLCTPEQKQQAERVAALLGPLAAGVFPHAVMHVPVETARRAREFARDAGADCAIAIGGGSTIGLGKAIALESSLPIIAIPTTYAGSEMTPIFGLTEGGVKRTGRDPRVLPRTVIYDPELSRALPAGLSFVSGLNAIAHAAEGLYARDSNPIIAEMAEQGIRAVVLGLRGIRSDCSDLEARGECLYGAWLCGTVLGHGGMALHHKLCHTLGGTFDLPHAETHAIVLPHVLAYNARASAEAMSRIARAIDRENPAAGIFELARELGVPAGLRDIGMKEADLDRACRLSVSSPYWNPEPIVETAIRRLLQDAWEGAVPRDHPWADSR